MTKSLNWKHLRILTREAVHDAFRRRIVFAVLVLCFLGLMMLNTCTSCEGQVQIQGDMAQGFDVSAWSGFGLFGVLCLWTITLAGLLASDQLTQSLADGNALLVLSRPVGRDSYVVSRLLGSLAVALLPGLALLGGAGLLLMSRLGLSPGPAVVAALYCVGNSIAIASFAMAASLYLPRVAIFLLTLVVIGVTSSTNLASLAGMELSGIYGLVDRLGPPLASSVAVALAPWSGRMPPGVSVFDVTLRTMLWAGFGVVTLVAVFRRWEIEGPTDR